MDDVETISFYCTRCGTGLHVSPKLAGQRVRCPHCATAVRAPDLREVIPVARLAVQPLSAEESGPSLSDDEVAERAEHPLSDDEAIDALRMLEHASRPSTRTSAGTRESIDVLAERLTRVQMPEPSDKTAMTECPFCGSTIAPYVGRCPFCHHPLHGS